MEPRELTARERDVLVAMIRHARAHAAPEPGQDERQQWLARVPEARVFGVCQCGHCPSVDLWPTDEPGVGHHVLQAWSPGLGLLLFIQGGRPTYLEGYPLDPDGVAREFPPVDEITYP